MSSTFIGLETALRGLVASQSALDTTGNNISNASTPGYSRQVAELQTTPAFQQVGSGQLGTGVSVVQYQRIRDNFIDIQYRAQTMRQGSYEAQQSGLSQVEQTLAEPSSNGLSELLSNYWSSWQDVANDPSNMATRQAVISSAQSLADGFNNLSSQLNTIASQTTTQETQTLTQVNTIGTQIAALNTSIQASELGGSTPNNLLDQRDTLIDQLSSLANTSVSPSAGAAGTLGAVDITFGGATLVTSNTATTITSPLPNVTSGQLAGMASVVSSITDPTTGYLAQLNALAAGLASATNTQNKAGIDLNGNAGGNFFDVTSGNEAGTISVDAGILAAPGTIAASTNGDTGDGSNALAISNLQQASLVNGATIDTSYQQLVTKIGSDSQQAQTNLDNANSIVASLSNQRQSVSGVSLDEEMTNLVSYQRGYEACAKVMAAMDSMLNTLITSVGGT